MFYMVFHFSPTEGINRFLEGFEFTTPLPLLQCLSIFLKHCVLLLCLLTS